MPEITTRRNLPQHTTLTNNTIVSLSGNCTTIIYYQLSPLVKLLILDIRPHLHSFIYKNIFDTNIRQILPTPFH